MKYIGYGIKLDKTEIAENSKISYSEMNRRHLLPTYRGANLFALALPYTLILQPGCNIVSPTIKIMKMTGYDAKFTARLSSRLSDKGVVLLTTVRGDCSNDYYSLMFSFYNQTDTTIGVHKGFTYCDLLIDPVATTRTTSI